jgi:hypothetical protein
MSFLGSRSRNVSGERSSLIPALGIDDSSCPALRRAPTPSRGRFAGRIAALYQPLADGWKQLRRVDARHKAGHDGGWKSSELA